MSLNIVDDDPHDYRLFIPNIEFYITNVCNLACKNCNRFNDHDFKGWQKWSDYADVYRLWADRVRLQRITILGGEPLLNPSIIEWIKGINGLWNRPVQILTNGTRLNHVNGLYDAISTWTQMENDSNTGITNWIGISLHNANDRQRCFAEIKKFLRGMITYHHKDDADNVNNAKTFGANHAFVDTNGVRVHVWEYNSFYNAAVQTNAQGKFLLHQSDPERAHAECGFARYKCYHFVKGKLYKCGPVALFPEFDQQHPFEITDQERDLMYSYLPLTVDKIESHGRQFLSEIDNVIPQCRFCPEKFQNQDLRATSKKPNSVSCYD